MDLLRDLIVLKSATKDEKGVVLLKYVRTFHAVVALLDFERLMERYVLVLEPCWTGYCDPGVLMLYRPGQPALVQCFFEADYQFIARLGEPFVPVRLGPADWVDADAFDVEPAADKPYDLVMVANWAKHKRHALLFRALGELRDRKLRVLLVGFPWAGRTAENIRAEARALCSSSATIDIRESIPHRELATLLVHCKVFVFLSKKEGDNKALVEAMFANVPALVYEGTIGGALSRVNSETGVLSSEVDLPSKIRHMLDCHAQFAPRRWALKHTGSRVVTRVVDDALRRIANSEGRRYSTGIVEKCNSPNLAYKQPADRLRFQADYDFVLSCRRDTATAP